MKHKNVLQFVFTGYYLKSHEKGTMPLFPRETSAHNDDVGTVTVLSNTPVHAGYLNVSELVHHVLVSKQH